MHWVPGSAPPCPDGRGGGGALAQLSPWDPRGFPARAAPGVFLGLATLSQAGASLSQQGVAVLAVFFRAALHLTFSQMGTLVSAVSLGMMVGLTVAGVLVDRIGPRWLLGVGGGWSLLAGFGVSRIHGYGLLLALLFVMGIGLGCIPSAGTRAVFDAFAGRARGMVMGIRQTGVPLGAAVGAVLIPLLVPGWGTGGVFVAIALLVLASAWTFGLVIRRRGRARAPAARLPGLAWLKPALGPMAVGMMLVAAQYSVLTFTMADLSTRHGWTVAAAGLGLALVQVGGGAGRIGLGWWSDRRGGQRSGAIMGAAALGAAAALAFGWAPPSTPAGVLLAILVPLGIGAVGWNALVLTWSGERVPAWGAGQAMSWTGSAVFLGSALYPPAFGWVLDHTGHFSWAFSALALWMVLAGVLVVVVRRRDARSVAAAA